MAACNGQSYGVQAVKLLLSNGAYPSLAVTTVASVPTFTPITVATLGAPVAVAVGYIDSDGCLDIVAASSTYIAWFQNDCVATPSFTGIVCSLTIFASIVDWTGLAIPLLPEWTRRDRKPESC